MVKKDITSIEFIYCECGCGFTTSKYSIENGRIRYDRPKRFIPNHYRPLTGPNKGKEFSKEWRENISKTHKTPRPYRRKQWEELSYYHKHERIRILKPKPELCEMCNKIPSRELSNKSGKYLQDIDDWWYLCAKCHKIYDKIVERNLKQYLFTKNNYIKVDRDSKTGRFVSKERKIV